MIIWLFYVASLIYMELVYHLGCFGLSGGKVLLPLALIAILGSVQAMVVTLLRGKVQKIIFWVFAIGNCLVFWVQTIYFTVFKQPLQIRTMLFGGEDALTSYWKEILVAIGKASPWLILMTVPIVVCLICIKRKKWNVAECTGLQKIRVGFLLGVSSIVLFMVLSIGKYVKADFYAEYQEFYAPLSVAEQMGIVTMVHRDIAFEIETLFQADDDLPERAQGEEFVLNTPPPWNVETPTPVEVTPVPQTTGGNAENVTPEPIATATPTPQPKYYAYELDIDLLAQNCAGEKQKEWLAQYIVNEVPTRENEYTGIFEGYNLIYLTAEGFSTYAIHPELTPTLYKLANTGFVFNNYYVPLWQTSTSDGEYVNCTGLIPDGQFSMRKSGSNNMVYSLPKFFATEGVPSWGFHNNTLSYYDRHITHPNLGYHFMASKLGECSAAEWGDNIFPMENPNRWPSSDLEMMQGTMPYYVGEDRFHVYYMTISGHMYYSFSGNSMSSKNRDAVKGLDMSENARAYIACHIELDKALEYLLQELEAAGKLENTVICLSADHYPYAMSEEEYEELAGRDLSANLEKFRNTLILWNAGMEEPVIVDKVCGSMDLVPTLLNLFGFSFDSRMYAGKDIFSEEEGLVIFNDRSFVSDTVIYDSGKRTTTWKRELTDAERDAYMTQMKQEVKDRYNFSAYILRENFYDVIEHCRLSQ